MDGDTSTHQAKEAMLGLVGETRNLSQLPVNEQEKSVADLHEAIKTLSARLHPVLSPDNSVEEGNKLEEADRIEYSPIREQMLATNKAIMRASRLLRNLIERLEV